jgi:ribonucleoside-diphosphate reductase alpha chain
MEVTMNSYQEYIAKSRYSRYLDDKKRREHWHETVKRYFDFMEKSLQDQYGHEMDRERLENAVLSLKVMPSMRSLMSAGPALSRDNTAGYNCSYLPVDDPKAFDEAMFILLCGTGVGFSVEDKYTNKLQEVPDDLVSGDTVIVVEDSKEGWAKALRKLIALLYTGEIPTWNTSKVRAAGERLKTFGGRASGPGPLQDLFYFVVTTFTKARGRRLSSLECHDIMCKIGEVVVVGGVRRSAMISLSDLQDDRMRHAKAGDWWSHNVQRALSNNSAVYDGRPEMDLFMPEWLSIFQSKSGERGIFNRKAAVEQVKKNGRRDSNYEFGTNPCSEIILRPYQFCNLTEVIVRSQDDEDSLRDKVEIATILGTYQSTLTHFPYLRKIWQKNTEAERLLGVSMTGILDNAELSFGVDSAGIQKRLKQVAVNTNKKLADMLGIPQSAAITCVKPSGTVSQLCDTASGLHPRHSAFYIRRVRSDNKDPITTFLISQGIPHEADVTKPDQTTVFSFPTKAPVEATTRDDMTAMEHFKLWLSFQRNWCEHKPSVTINVKDEEWMGLGAAVYKNFDEISGIAFLPFDGGTYRQAPYEAIDEATYESLKKAMPSEIKWEDFMEIEDNVEGAQTLACVAGHCDIP